MENINRLTAFSRDPDGGNPAGVWIGTELPPDAEMLAAAAYIGYSETVFAVPTGGSEAKSFDVRYFSPEAEVPFCGHATIALGGHLGLTAGPGEYALATRAGEVALSVSNDEQGPSATLTSVEPSSKVASDLLVDLALGHLGWDRTVLDSGRPTVLAYAGAWHLILPLATRESLAEATYSFDAMKALMLAEDLTTVDLVWHETDLVVHCRNLFAVGGVVEDPATGAAAAAFVGHLRSSGQIEAPADITIHQGHDMGRPSLLEVCAPATGGIEVTGAVVAIDA